MEHCNRFVRHLAGACALAAAGAASGAPITFANSGFEDISGELPQLEFTFGPLNGWDLYDPDGITGGGAGPGFFIGTLTPTAVPPDPPEFFPAGAPEGQRVGIAFNFANTVSNTGVDANGDGLDDNEYGFERTLGDTLQAGILYTLEVEIGNIASGQSLNGADFNLEGFPGYRIELLAGGVVIAEQEDAIAPAEGTFQTATLSFLADALTPQLGGALGIRLINRNVIDTTDALTAAADREVDFDDVRLSAALVAEPGSIALLVAGLLASGWPGARGRRAARPRPGCRVSPGVA